MFSSRSYQSLLRRMEDQEAIGIEIRTRAELMTINVREVRMIFLDV